jgi:hypothetical protein
MAKQNVPVLNREIAAGNFSTGDGVMKVLMSAMMAAMLVAAAPVWADRGHGQWSKRHNGNYHAPHGHYKHHPRQDYGYYERHHYRHPKTVRRYYYESYAYPAYPAYRAPGVHVVLPDVFITF